MARLRKSVYAEGDVWSDTLLWYARGVAALKARPLADPTSWRFFGAIHNFDAGRWDTNGDYDAVEPQPSDADVRRYWKQCQHQSWYFLPWHRGYLHAFERLIREAIHAEGGPADWALPYWNYYASAPGSARLPAAFSSPVWPGEGPNPLYTPIRYGETGDGANIVIDLEDLEFEKFMREGRFSYPAAFGGGAPGFGGPPTDFQRYGPTSGLLEEVPHNNIHGLIGGGTEQNPGLMSQTITAGLDPIFWLHHCNIDRLWEVWLARSPGNSNPSEATWLDGPVRRAFAMPTSTADWPFTPRDVLDIRAMPLDYEYDDVSDPLGGRPGRREARLTRFGLEFASSGDPGEAFLPRAVSTELIGANDQRLRLGAVAVETTVSIRSPEAGRLKRTFSSFVERADVAEPDRVFLNLEGIKSQSDIGRFAVYVGLAGQTLGEPAITLVEADGPVGVFSLFGVSEASRFEDEHGAHGATKVIEITDAVDYLLENNSDLTQLRVRVEPLMPGEGSEITIERISLYRQGG
jgi:tyrosinase